METEKPEVQEQPQHNKDESPASGDVVETTAVETSQQDEDQKGAVTSEIHIEVYDMELFIGAIIRGEKNADIDLVQPNIEALKEFALMWDCSPGEEIIAGCRVKGK